MKRLFLFVMIATLTLSLMTTAHTAKVIPPSSQDPNVAVDEPSDVNPDPINLPGWNQAKKAEPIPDLPRVAVVIKNFDDPSDIDYIGSIIESELIDLGKDEKTPKNDKYWTVVPYQRYLEWLNAMQNWTRTSGRYDPASLPQQGKYLAPTHVIGINIEYEWVKSGLGVSTKYGDFGGSSMSLVAHITGQLYDLTKATALCKIDCQGKSKSRSANVGYYGSLSLDNKGELDFIVESTVKGARQIAEQLKEQLKP